MKVPALPFGFSGASSPGLLISGRCVLMGLSMAETAGAVAVWSIFDGSASGVNIFRVNLNPLESTREWFGPNGIAFEQGVFVARTSGTVTGSVLVIPETRWDTGTYEYMESTG